MALITTLQAVSTFCGTGADTDEVRDSWLAAEQYVADRCRWAPVPQVDDEGQPVVDDEGEPVLGAPASLVQAVKLQAARYLARRRSPDGLVNIGSDFGPSRIPITDRDVQDAMSSYRMVVV